MMQNSTALATILEARPVNGSFVIEPTDNDAMPSAAEFVDMFEASEDASYEARQLAERDRDYVDNIQLTPEEQLDERMQEGYDLAEANRQVEACDAWLAAWDMVVGLARPEMRSVEASPRRPSSEHPPFTRDVRPTEENIPLMTAAEQVSSVSVETAKQVGEDQIKAFDFRQAARR
jgi:hypothetical protein